jgi:hypothetical protein
MQVIYLIVERGGQRRKHRKGKGKGACTQKMLTLWVFHILSPLQRPAAVAEAGASANWTQRSGGRVFIIGH